MSDALLHPTIGTAALTALMGYLVVFFGILLLLIVVTVMGKIMISFQKKADAKAAPAVPAAPLPTARGTAGELKLHDVDPRDAAMVMAIVAHRLNKPLNELRFRSIKEVKGK